MKAVFSDVYNQSEEQIRYYIKNFKEDGEVLGSPARNVIKIFNLEGEKINIKSFKIPNAVNKIAYRHFRKSKAQRSFEYAQLLISLGIGTPAPIAYFEEKSKIVFLKSFYVSRQQDCDLTFRELVNEPNLPNHEKILRAFTRFTHELHEKNIEFLDHSPGNTLIQLNDGDYKFFLVDLNRMNFKPLDFEARMKNFSRLTPKKEMVKVMASEYAKLINKPEEEVFQKMWFYTKNFQEKFKRKKRLKKKLKFWKAK
ncbi:lipopolysaccharide kinase InaA family protein [Salinimicrobium sp. GXAS 041]|uniref:lipopolysaccharide kinase InaA family protein n=1 Tax=Salinimicrobium sp. GXAS 041 TaxID=3400806 RepID=UPI003C738719